MATIETYATPSRLYRYRALTDANLEREVSAIADGYIFCPSFKELNDPMEGAHSESAILKKARVYANAVAQVTAAKAKLGIASFSETHRSEPMWAYYAGDFRGICVSYNLKKLLAELRDEEHAFVRMGYNEKPPMLLSDHRTADERARMVLSTKTVRWSSEREWRLIRAARGQATYRSSNCVVGIYMGSRISAEHRAALLKVAAQSTIPVWAMEIDKYELSFKRVMRARRPLKKTAPR